MERLHASTLEQETAADTPVVKNIRLKKKMLDSGDPKHETIKPAIIFEGGGMRGAYQHGVGIALAELGMGEVFDTVVGLSNGAVTGAYFLSGQHEQCIPILELLANSEFIDFFNPVRGEKILNMRYMEKVFRKFNPLDQEAVRRSRSNFFIGMTELRTGKGVYFDMKDSSRDIVTDICASSSVPGLTKPITINGVKYSDAMTGCVNPVDFALEQGCTDILVVSNKPYGENNSQTIFERLFLRFVLRGYGYPSEFLIAHLPRRQPNGINFIPDSVNLGILRPKDMPLGRLSRDINMMKMVVNQSKMQSKSLFS